MTVQVAKDAIEDAFAKVLGQKPKLVIVEQEGAAPVPAAAQAEVTSLAEQKQKQRSVAQNARLAMGREHPNVRAAVELLGGEIEDVKDLGEE
jgi:hypothetical protein